MKPPSDQVIERQEISITDTLMQSGQHASALHNRILLPHPIRKLSPLSLVTVSVSMILNMQSQEPSLAYSNIQKPRPRLQPSKRISTTRSGPALARLPLNVSCPYPPADWLQWFRAVDEANAY